jgi:hypothetical protein
MSIKTGDIVTVPGTDLTGEAVGFDSTGQHVAVRFSLTKGAKPQDGWFEKEALALAQVPVTVLKAEPVDAPVETETDEKPKDS